MLQPFKIGNMIRVTSIICTLAFTTIARVGDSGRYFLLEIAEACVTKAIRIWRVLGGSNAQGGSTDTTPRRGSGSLQSELHTKGHEEDVPHFFEGVEFNCSSRAAVLTYKSHMPSTGAAVHFALRCCELARTS